MEYVLLIISFILVILGCIGCIVPALPGPPLAWLGLLTIYFTKGIPISYWILGITLVLTLIITVLDYVLPAQGTKKFGGTQYGMYGTYIGLVVGLFVPFPGAFFIGPFLGAFVGELLYDSSSSQRAFKAATGSFIGLVASTFFQLVTCFILLFFLLRVVWKYSAVWF